MTLSDQFADTNCCLPLALGLVIFSEEVTCPIPSWWVSEMPLSPTQNNYTHFTEFTSLFPVT